MEFDPQKELSLLDTSFEITPDNEQEYFDKWGKLYEISY